MNMKSTMICGLAFMLFVTGCSKKDEPGPTPSVTTKTDLLVKKDWIMTSLQVQQSGFSTWSDN